MSDIKDFINTLRQRHNHKKWLKENNGKEYSTRMETLLRPEQQERIKWIVDHVVGRTVLDIGCNMGYVSNQIALGGYEVVGIDKNEALIYEAQDKYPSAEFWYFDITKARLGNKFDTVVLADVLEHIKWGDVPFVIEQARYIAKMKILITLPWRLDEKFALCFKHEWIPTYRADDLRNMLWNGFTEEFIANDAFWCIEITK